MCTKPAEKAFVACLFVTVIAICVAISGCTSKTNAADGKQARPAAPVTVATVSQETIPIQIRAIGNVETIATVAIRAQVQGELKRVYFREGQDVKKGDLLFEIDPRVYEQAVAQAEANLGRERAAVSQAEANVERDQAQARLSQVQSSRYDSLAQKGVISREQNDQVRTTAAAQEKTVLASQAGVESARANVKAAEAAVQDAKVRLSFTKIRAPISGRTGSLTVKEGNLVSVGGETPLVVINQITPIYVSFAVPEQNLPAIRQRTSSGKLPVEASPQQQTPGGPTSTGVLTFLENAVDPATGTIKCKATFSNEGRELWPGEFVNVTLTLDTLPDAVLVPSQAVQTGQKGNYVFVVREDNTAEQRPVVSTRQFKNMAVIDKGVKPGERVITDGHLKVVPNGKVQIVARGDATSSAAGVPTPTGL